MDFAIKWESGMLVVEISGFWSGETMLRYEAAVTAALRAAPPGGFLMLADLSAAPAQSAPIVERHVETTAQITAAGCRAIATVVPSALLRRQVDRATSLPIAAQEFATIADARAWLSTISAQSA